MGPKNKFELFNIDKPNKILKNTSLYIDIELIFLIISTH